MAQFAQLISAQFDFLPRPRSVPEVIERADGPYKESPFKNKITAHITIIIEKKIRSGERSNFHMA